MEALATHSKHVMLGEGSVERSAALRVDRPGEVQADDFSASVIRQGRDGEGQHGLIPSRRIYSEHAIGWRPRGQAHHSVGRQRGRHRDDVAHAAGAVIQCVIFGISIIAVFGLYRLGSLPGRIARFRRHPLAHAISVCGWLGLLVVVLWPIAYLWAYKTPKTPAPRSLTDEDLDNLTTSLRET